MSTKDASLARRARIQDNVQERMKLVSGESSTISTSNSSSTRSRRRAAAAARQTITKTEKISIEKKEEDSSTSTSSFQNEIASKKKPTSSLSKEATSSKKATSSKEATSSLANKATSSMHIFFGPTLLMLLVSFFLYHVDKTRLSNSITLQLDSRYVPYQTLQQQGLLTPLMVTEMNQLGLNPKILFSNEKEYNEEQEWPFVGFVVAYILIVRLLGEKKDTKSNQTTTPLFTSFPLSLLAQLPIVQKMISFFTFFQDVIGLFMVIVLLQLIPIAYSFLFLY